MWLVWAVLFQAAVNVDCPRGFVSRFMAHVWALFALIFLAIYTANLAAFMITREEFPDLSGLDDSRLANPTSQKPPFRFGTIPNGAIDFVLKNNFPHTQSYMKRGDYHLIFFKITHYTPFTSFDHLHEMGLCTSHKWTRKSRLTNGILS